MFYYISKIAWFVLQPSAFFVLMIVAGLLISRTRWRSWSRRIIITASGALLLIAFSPLGRQLMIPLEDRFPLPSLSELEGKNIKGLVVLGGTVHMTITDQRGVPSVVSGAERIIETVKLAKKFPQAQILLIGGPNTLISKPTPDSEIVRQMLLDMGLESSRIKTENRSRNTWQNAKYTRDMGVINRGENWLLITSAYHMPRAIGCYRAAGLTLIPYPVDYMTGGEASRFAPFYYAMDGFTITDMATKEWLGLLAYRLTGRIKQLFPGQKRP